ncbi:MAG: SDR family NAD(P)-dependent oxidoreductase [Pseudomonadota bacterium]
MSARRIVLTGASGGIGRALVRAYAAPGTEFLLIGRNVEALGAAQQDAEAAGGSARIAALSVTDRTALPAALTAFTDLGPVDIFFAAAGVKVGNSDGHEPPGQSDRVIAVNLGAAIEGVQSLLPPMQKEGAGQIVLFSSVAALSPTPDMLSYAATKAGLRAYGTALRRAVYGTGVTVHVVTPGFVDTDMTDRHLGPTPFKTTATRAARIIKSGLERGRVQISFPLALVILVRAMNLLPPALSDRISHRFMAEIVPDGDEHDQSQG